MNSESKSDKSNNNKSGLYRYLKIFVGWVIPAVIIFLAISFAKHQIATRPQAQQQPPTQQARLVNVETAKQVDHQTFVSAMGTVIPARQVTINPEVSGRVVSISEKVIPGGLILSGRELLRIDSRDYEAIVDQRKSDLANAELNLKLEYGSQTVARHEYELLAELIEHQDMELVLRKPHLRNAQAAVEASAALLEKAQLDVERCKIEAPFNLIIQDKLQDVGAIVSPSTAMLTVIGTDEYWLKVMVPIDQLRWITIPKTNSQIGSKAKIYNPKAWGPDAHREGTVIRLLGKLEEYGRMAQVLILVKDPLCLESDHPQGQPILINSYVRVEIEGQKIESVIPVTRDYLRDGKYVWIMNEQNEMEIRSVEIVFRDRERVYISDGIKAGEQIVTTDISTPVNKMLLRTNDAPDNSQQVQPAENGEAK